MNTALLTLADSAFDVLVAMLFLSTVACLLVLLNLRFGKTSATDRFSVWKLVVVILLVAPLSTALLPTVPLGWIANQTQTREALTATPDSGISTETSSPGIKAKTKPGFQLNPLVTASQDESSEFDPTTPQDLQTSIAVTSISQSANSPADVAALLQSARQLPWPMILTIVWLAGIPVLLLRLAYSWSRIRAIERDTRPFPGNVKNSFYPILISDTLPVPVTTGIRKSKIILPAEAVDWSSETLRMVVRHESAHIQRRDVAWQLLAALTRCLYWPQPLLWIAEKRMDLIREKACDDRVLAEGEKPSDYAHVLLQIAARLSGRPQHLIGAIPVACKPIERRLASILEPLTPRVPGNRTARKTLGVAACVVAISCCSLRPFEQHRPNSHAPDEATVSLVSASTTQEQQPQEHEDPQFEKQVALPSLLKGKVLNADLVPVAGAEVNFWFTGRAKNSSSKIDVETGIELIGTTDELGQYAIDSSGYTFNGGYSGRGVVNANGYPQVPVPYIPNAVRDTIEMPNAVFYRKRHITGQIVSADSDSVPQNCNLRLVGNSARNELSSNEPPPYFYSPTIKCDESGRFETWIPRDMPVAASFHSDDHCGHQMMIQSDDADVGEIELRKGSKLSGRVLDKHNDPVAGVVVNIRSCEFIEFMRGDQKAQFRLLNYSVKTDDLGGYELPPFQGKCLVFVRQSGNHRDGSLLMGERKPPLIKPEIVELTGTDETVLNLVETDTVTVRGTLRWEDGTPAPNVDVSCRIVSELVEPIAIGGAFSDANGKYELKVPRYAEDGLVRISVVGDTNPANNEWCDAHINNDIQVVQKTERSMTLKATLTDLDGADWELRSRNRRSPPPTPAPAESDDQNDPAVQ